MAQKFRTLTSAPDSAQTTDGDTLKPVLKHRHVRLNELGAEGWELQSTVVAADGTFVDTLSQTITAA